MKSVKCLFVLIAALWSLQLQAQQAIQGVVLDEIKEPLIGADVKVKGAGVKTATDEDGRFSLSLAKGDSILIFEYLGFKPQEVKITPAMTTVTVVMEAVNRMRGEFVVTSISIKREEKSICHYGSWLVDAPSSKLAEYKYNGKLHNKLIVDRTKPDYGNGHKDGCTVQGEMLLELTDRDSLTLAGTVKDSRFGYPLGASITVWRGKEAEHIQVGTDGRFVLNRYPAPVKMMKLEYIGFRPLTIRARRKTLF